MSFVSPGQVTSLVVDKDIEVRRSGWHLVIHPDFLWNTPLAGNIKKYEFWDYAVNESLFLSEKEEEIVLYCKNASELLRFVMFRLTQLGSFHIVS